MMSVSTLFYRFRSCVLIWIATLGIVVGLVDFHFLLYILRVLLILSTLFTATISVFFSERELMFRFAICYRRSVCRLSVVCLSSVCLWRWCTLLSRLKFSAIFLRHLVPWPSLDIHWKFYGDRPRGTPPSGDVNARGVAKYSDFWHLECYNSETVQDRR